MCYTYDIKEIELEISLSGSRNPVASTGSGGGNPESMFRVSFDVTNAPEAVVTEEKAAKDLIVKEASVKRWENGFESHNPREFSHSTIII